MRLRNIPYAQDVIKEHVAVVQKPQEQKGKWAEIFGNENPIHIEIGMGKGKFLMGMASAHPEINYIGIEKYTSVLLRAAEKYDTEEFCELQNIKFIRMDATGLKDVFEPGEIEKIYLNFSDPWPKSRHAKRRLTSVECLARYKEVLPENGWVEFKTDNTALFDFSLEQAEEARWLMISCTYDLHNNEEMNRGNIMTEYEEKFSSKGQPIHKMIIQRP
ncbi:MAG: tRNA (guanosine(46)-N7)-methyltransferase TrmB [Schaedlerella sp.]|nr:tRNA (guanosine(46)-N7)-methyltransferase TrmB [Schaedlerella sp.]